METRINEIADGIYRLSTFVPDIAPPAGFTFNQFLVLGDEPLLFHTGLRQMFPLITSSISESAGLEFFVNSDAACIICPAWQYPHCGTSNSIQAACTGWLPSVERPSMVVTLLPATRETCVWQDRTALPSRCTVHAPHRPAPHPNLVPVIPSTSRKTHNKGISGTASTDCAFPFTLNLIIAMRPPRAI